MLLWATNGYQSKVMTKLTELTDMFFFQQFNHRQLIVEKLDYQCVHLNQVIFYQQVPPKYSVVLTTRNHHLVQARRTPYQW